ncbi:hypothetical protein HPP92_018042 [Vanilla planifolia]|uniref:TRUD domain-containing protein n=1 Tax=Vanilla planifolia TaxID=51239 RepID=A0A835UME9_VANPL|nr:hypothetical protein HPP92_018612 [Vanilla planifolia]KAG0468714.1 hypothetical protein HPP92_018042 [Vanilla planifolia]
MVEQSQSQMYSDFIVNEVDREGRIVRLTSFELPPDVTIAFPTLLLVIQKPMLCSADNWPETKRQVPKQCSFGFAGTKIKRAITKRSVVADSRDTIKAAADGLGRNGFINYYGLQRFGCGSVPTHPLVLLFLGEQSVINEETQKYKRTGHADFCLRQLPGHLVAERSIIQCLKKCPGNYLQSLQGIPRTLRLMYVHSYQSYLWNHAASMRVAKHGMTQVVVGDLVFCKEDSSDKAASLNSSEPHS